MPGNKPVSNIYMRKPSLLLGTLLTFLQVIASTAADFALKVADKEPPKELDTSIRAKLQTKAVQVLEGEKPVYEFWFSAEVPLQSKPASPGKALDAIKQATLLGAVAVTCALAACGSSSSSEAKSAVKSYLKAFATGDGKAACSLMAEETRAGGGDARELKISTTI